MNRDLCRFSSVDVSRNKSRENLASRAAHFGIKSARVPNPLARSTIASLLQQNEFPIASEHLLLVSCTTFGS
jgi:hypothetical protein